MIVPYGPCLINNPVKINSATEATDLIGSYLSVDHNIFELISSDNDCSIKGNFSITRKVITKLFKKIKKNPKRYINIKKYSNLNTERTICDYIAGMTDNFAHKEYFELFPGRFQLSS